MDWKAVEQIIWLFGGLLGFEIFGFFILDAFKHPLVRDAERDYRECMEHRNAILHKGGKV